MVEAVLSQREAAEISGDQDGSVSDVSAPLPDYVKERKEVGISRNGEWTDVYVKQILANLDGSSTVVCYVEGVEVPFPFPGTDFQPEVTSTLPDFIRRGKMIVVPCGNEEFAVPVKRIATDGHKVFAVCMFRGKETKLDITAQSQPPKKSGKTN